MAEDLRNLDKVDLKYVDLSDPPMVAVTKSKHFDKIIWLIIGIGCSAAAAFGILVYIFNR